MLERKNTSYSLFVFNVAIFWIGIKNQPWYLFMDAFKSFVVKRLLVAVQVYMYYPKARIQCRVLFTKELTTKFINSNYSSATKKKKNRPYTIKMYKKRLKSLIMINVPAWILCNDDHSMRLEKSYHFVINSFVKRTPARRPPVYRKAIDEFGPTTIPLISLHESQQQESGNQQKKRINQLVDLLRAVEIITFDSSEPYENVYITVLPSGNRKVGHVYSKVTGCLVQFQSSCLLPS